MPRKRRLQKKTWSKRASQSRSTASYQKAFADVDHQLKSACHTLEKHAKPNVNMYTFARDTQKVMLLMAELRYLINACKTAQNLRQRKQIGKYKNKSNRKNKNIKRRRRAA